jgi:D-serine deaminase-like pyridoxal phosphate-dependent protein
MSVTIADLPTPFVAVDLAKLTTNIAAMQSLATSAGVRLRPHTKTHKSINIARMQIDAGAAGLCCAKLGEAEVLADAGFTDLRLPYPVNPSNVARVQALQKKGVALSIIVDSLTVAEEWSRAMAGAPKPLEVLVKVDVGFHRCGIDPEAGSAVSMIRRVADLSGLRFRGLLSHAGHAYNAESIDALGQIAEREIEILRGLAARVRDAGVAVDEISVGSTPTARFITIQQGVTEMRPGNYVFFDRTQAGLRATAAEQCAMTVVSTVVSRPAPGRVVFDAGSKTLTSDGARGFGAVTGHGLVYPSLETSQPDPAIAIERLSEEHSVARVTAACALKPGDRVRILPNHACTVTNLADSLAIVEGTRVIEHWPVSARGKNY